MMTSIVSCSPFADSSVDVEPGSTLVIDLAGEYIEAPEASVLARLVGDEGRPFLGLLALFNRAERDDRITTVVLRIQPLQIGWGKADEIRAAIGRLRRKGLHVAAHLEVQGIAPNKELFIASAADEAFVSPGSVTPLVGLAAEYIHFGGLFEKLGVEFDVAKAGLYKSAVEVYQDRTMSEATREMADSLLDDTFDRFVNGLADGRGLERKAVIEAIDQGPIRSQQLEALGLLDGEIHLDKLLDRFGGEVVSSADYAKVRPEELGVDAKVEFALIYGSGTVVQGDSSGSALSGSPAFASESTSRAILDAAEDPEISAIIFRIDSPGGSALASESIWRAVTRAQELGTPVIASFSDYAASGGYYVAAGADAIVSDPGTLTGSIGVYALRPVLGGLLEKFEIEIDSITRGRHADFLLSSEKMSAGGLARLQTSVIDTYQLFLTRVSEGRGISVQAVDLVAQGRVWTGRQALEVGLVDELGGMHTAVARAKREIGLNDEDDVYLVPFPRSSSLSDQIFAVLQSSTLEVRRPIFEWPEPLEKWAKWVGEWPTGSPLLIPPALIEIR
jgi:protease IV